MLSLRLVPVLTLVLGLGASAAVAVPGSDPGPSFDGLTRTAPPVAVAVESLVRVVDDVGTTVEVLLPQGTTRVVLEPALESSDELSGWLVAYDSAGNTLVRRPESVGLAVHLREPGTLLRRLADIKAGPVEVRVPAGASVIRLVSQNYDRECNPRRDGRLLVFDPAGKLMAEEDGLALDVLTP